MYEVAPGTHTVAVWYQTGRLIPGPEGSSFGSTSEAQKTARVTYRAPIDVLFNGKLTSEGPSAGLTLPSGTQIAGLGQCFGMTPARIGRAMAQRSIVCGA